MTTVRLIADLEGDTRSYVNATRALADRYFREGNLEAALREYRVVFEKLNDRLYLAITHRKIGDTKLSEFKKALEHYELYLGIYDINNNSFQRNLFIFFFPFLVISAMESTNFWNL